jgi:HEAT repeat protein/lysophospholipase L1-like esterase
VKRGLVVNLALAAASSALFLALLEGAARLLEKPAPPRAEVADYIWDWDDKMPGGFYVMKSDGVGWPPWEEFNRDGLRDRTRTHEKPEGLRRIAILGDSVTLGAEIRPDEAYPQRLEARFRAEGRRVEVMNVALWGWSTRQERTAWRRIARAYHPDQALLAVCLNDIPELFNNLSRPPRWLTRLHEHSAVVRRLVNAEGREIDSVERLFAEPDSPRVRQAMDRFFEEVRALRRDVEADGATLAVVVFPFRFQVDQKAPPPVVQRRIAAFCEAERLRCLDLLPTLGRLGPSAFVDYDHLSPTGTSLVADTLYASGLLGNGESVTALLHDALGGGATDASALTLALTRAGSTGVRAECAAALGGLGPAARPAVPALFTALGDPSEAVRAAAARSLAAIGPGPEDVPRLVAALGSRDTYVVAFAAWSLGNLGSAAESAVPDLAHALARDDTNAVVAGALARIGPAAAGAVDALVEGLRGDDVTRRWRAARTLGRIGPPAASAVPSLTTALSDSDSLVRLHAARALGRIGPAGRPAAAALQRATGDKDPNVGEEARQALKRLN